MGRQKKVLKLIVNFFLICAFLFGGAYCSYYFWQFLNISRTKYEEPIKAISYSQYSSQQNQAGFENQGLDSVINEAEISENSPNSEESTAEDEQTEQKEPTLFINQPQKNIQELLYTETSYPVEFNWTSEKGKKVTLEIFNTVTQDKAEQKYTFWDSGEKIVEIPAGNHWWRLTCGDEVLTGKISVTNSEKPQLISPAEETVKEYKSKTPEIRFVWTESKDVIAYKLRIADNPDMNNPVFEAKTTSTSAVISTLDAGTWYWDIIPAYEPENYDYLNKSEVSSFVISKTNASAAPVLIAPEEGEILTAKVVNKGQNPIYKPIYLSWKNNSEAINYTLKVWKNGISSPVVTVTTLNNYFALNPEEYNLQTGEYSWEVTATDIDGVKSTSEKRTFFTIEEELEIKTVFPAEDYKLASTRTQDLRFIWKANIDCESTFQLATDESFSDIIISKTISQFSLSGLNIPEGNYFWRICTTVAGVTIKTEPVSIFVIDQLEAPILALPKDGTREVITPGIPVMFRWKTVPGAEYYKFSLFHTKNPEKITYEKNYLVSTNGDTVTLKVYMDYMAETYYTWTVQAFCDESENSSRLTGRLATSNFRMRIWKPIKLVWPLDGAEYDGINAVLDPDNFIWTSVDKPYDSKLMLYKDTPISQYSSIDNPAFKQQMPRLYQGQYYWTVTARTWDNIDISAQDKRAFNIREMPKLAVPEMIYPPRNTIINIDYLINHGPKITFKWGKIDGIARYILRIFKKEDPSPLFEIKLAPDKNEYVFQDEPFLNTLGKYDGGWYWSIEAQSDYYGELFQRGETELYDITVNIPRNKPEDVETIPEHGVTRYGTDIDPNMDENIKKKLKNSKKPTGQKEEKTKNSNKSKKTKKAGA